MQKRLASNLGLEGIEAFVLRTVNDQPTLWDSILPPELVLPVELGRVDALLDDAAFFTPFAVYFDARIGRPSTPVETYLRLMFLKCRYRRVLLERCFDGDLVMVASSPHISAARWAFEYVYQTVGYLWAVLQPGC